MVSTILHRWVIPYGVQVGVGLVCWVLCSVAAAVYAAQTESAVLPTLVTWNEWLGALVLIPALFSISAPKVRPAMGMARWIAATVLGLDILVRALFGLGWQPFF